MRRPEGKPIIRLGTPPTPEDPAPSNQIIEEYPDGTRIIRGSGKIDDTVLNEYKEALALHPNDAGLRYYYAMSLKFSGDLQGALVELEKAVSLAPENHSYQGMLGSLLNEAGRPEEALGRKREALRLLKESHPHGREQSEVLSHWGISEALAKLGRAAEARNELQRAVELQRNAVAAGAASEQLLRQLEGLLEASS